MVTMMTAPEPDAHLVAFYRRVRPGGAGWSRIANIPARAIAGSHRRSDAGWLLVYAVLFGIGSIALGSFGVCLMCSIVAAAVVAISGRDLSWRGWKKRLGVNWFSLTEFTTTPVPVHAAHSCRLQARV
jgi:hypothetical protein